MQLNSLVGFECLQNTQNIVDCVCDMLITRISAPRNT